jgi:peptide-methionine (S)-S-oxide reductase
MNKYLVALAAIAMAALTFVGSGFSAIAAQEKAVKLPAPTLDSPAAAQAGTATAVFAGGCFWGVQAVFQHTNGVLNAVSGYAGGDKATARYEAIGSAAPAMPNRWRSPTTPSSVSYGTLLQIYFSVAHDPTTLNRQGPDSGTQYRSAVFYRDAEQKRVTEAYIAQLDAAKVFPQDRDAAGAAGLLPGRGLPPGLRHPAPPASPTSRIPSTCPRSPT